MAARKPRQQWGELSERSRARATREAAQYGLTRKQARERYNRGTYKPFARETVLRAPQTAPQYPIGTKRDLEDAALRNYDRQFGDEFGYNRFTVEYAIRNKAPLQTLVRMAQASKDELTTWASYQTKRTNRNWKPKDFNRDLGWYHQDSGSNIFWYH